MVQWPFSTSANPILGVDIGTAALRVVELEPDGNERPTLANYGSVASKYLYGKPFRQLEKDTLSLSTKSIAEALTSIIQEAGIETKRANFTLPDFSSFFTTLNMPAMGRDELQEAIQYEARQHVPMPTSELVLDWMPTEELTPERRQQDANVQILLVAIPQRVVDQYRDIADKVGLQLESLEAEVFSLARSLSMPEREEGAVALLDVGAQSTTCSIAAAGAVKASHSFDASGDDLTRAIMEHLDVETETAEQLKVKFGLSEEGRAVGEVLKPTLDSIIMEAEKTFQHFHQQEGAVVNRVKLAGGTANLRGIAEYFSEKMRTDARVAQPFERVSYPQILRDTLGTKGPEFAVALGVGLGGLEA